MFGATLYAEIGTFIVSPPRTFILKIVSIDLITFDLYVTVIYFDDYAGNLPLVISKYKNYEHSWF